MNYDDFNILKKQLFQASKDGDLETIKNLHANKIIDIFSFDDYALCMSCYKGYLDMATYLVENGANINNDNNNPITQASRMGHLEIVKLLLSHWKIKTSPYSYIIKEACHNNKFNLLFYICSELNNPQLESQNIEDTIIYAQSLKKEDALIWITEFKNIIKMKNNLDKSLNDHSKIAKTNSQDKKYKI